MWSDKSRFTLLQSDGRIRVRRVADEVLPSTYNTDLRGQHYNIGLLQLVRSRFSDVMYQKKLGHLTTRIN